MHRPLAPTGLVIWMHRPWAPSLGPLIRHRAQTTQEVYARRRCIGGRRRHVVAVRVCEVSAPIAALIEVEARVEVCCCCGLLAGFSRTTLAG
jgi:hypothetical protein